MGSYMPNGVNFAPVFKVLKDTNAQEWKLRFYGTNIHLSILHKDIGCNIPPIKGAQIKKRSFRPLFLFKNHVHIRQTDIFCGCIFLIFHTSFFLKVTTLNHWVEQKYGLTNQMEVLMLDLVVRGQ